MGYKTFVLTLISAKDLKNVNLIGKMDVYVVVSISGDPNSKQKTPVHQDGGTKPSWNYTMRFTFDEAAAVQYGWMVVFQLKHEHTFGADKDLGEVRVPVKELIDGFADNKDARVVTYPVRRPSGNPKGELKFSYKFTDVTDRQKGLPPVEAYPPQACRSSAAAYAQPVTAYPPPPAVYPQAGYQPTGYPPPPPAAGYPQAPYGGYPPQQAGGYGYGYGYRPAGYPVQGQVMPQKPWKNGGFGMGLGAGLLGGAIGGLLIGDMVSDAYEDGFDAGVADADFDF